MKKELDRSRRNSRSKSTRKSRLVLFETRTQGKFILDMYSTLFSERHGDGRLQFNSGSSRSDHPISFLAGTHFPVSVARTHLCG